MVLGRPAAPAPVLAQRASLWTLAPFLGAPVRPHAPGLSQIRTMTEEASPVLADVLREEVKYEQESYKQPEARCLALTQYKYTSPTTLCACSTFRCRDQRPQKRQCSSMKCSFILDLVCFAESYIY